MITTRRVGSLGRAELLLLGRNRTALFSAFVLPLSMVLVVANLKLDGTVLITATLAFVLLAAVYYNLVTAYVARREELVLKRLRAGELTDAEILAGVAAPAVTIALAQSVLALAAGAVLLDLPAPRALPLMLLGLLGGAGVFVLLAAASAAFTRTTELAQVTTLPVLMGCLFGSGLLFPDDALPERVTDLFRLLPLSPVVELIRLGWTGGVRDAIVPVAVLAAWLVLGTVAVRRWFRWEPRR
jgi:ABC-2 type transport system permease protein